VERQIMIVKVIAVVLILAFTSFAKRMLTFKRKKVVAVGQSTAGKLADNKKNN
jgi:dienelactone hydrolase